MSAAAFASCSRSRRLRNAATKRRLYGESHHANTQQFSIDACKFDLLIEQVQGLATAVHTIMMYGPQPSCPWTTLCGQEGFINTDWGNDMSGAHCSTFAHNAEIPSKQPIECNSAESLLKDMQCESTEFCFAGAYPPAMSVAAAAEHSAESLANPDSDCSAAFSSDIALTASTHVAHMDDASPPDAPGSTAPGNDEDIPGRLPRDVLQALQGFLASVVPMLPKIYLAAVADKQKDTGHSRLLQLSAARRQHVIESLVTEVEKVAVAQFEKVTFKADNGLLRRQIQQFVGNAVQHEEDKLLQLMD